MYLVERAWGLVNNFLARLRSSAKEKATQAFGEGATDLILIAPEFSNQHFQQCIQNLHCRVLLHNQSMLSSSDRQLEEDQYCNAPLHLTVGRTPYLHYYYLALAVNTSYRSSLGITNPGIQALIVLD
jgi:hypothetical protein